MVYWVPCGTENMHIMGACPECYTTQGGLLLGTAANGYAGKITANCIDCGKAVDYFIDCIAEEIWMLDPVESRGIPRE